MSAAALRLNLHWPLLQNTDDFHIRGFAAKAPQAAIETVSTMSTKYNAVIEEDQDISITD